MDSFACERAEPRAFIREPAQPGHGLFAYRLGKSSGASATAILTKLTGL